MESTVAVSHNDGISVLPLEITRVPKE